MSVEDDERYVERSRAPLLEHLTELRNRLFVSVAALLVAFIIAFYFVGLILDFLMHPFGVASGLAELQMRMGHHNPFSLEMLKGVLGLTELPPPRAEFALQPIATGSLEVFLSKVKIAAFGAIILAFPVLAFQLYRFVAPGLYKNERRSFAPFLIAAPVLFVMGAALVYYVLLPFLWLFNLNQQSIGTTIIKSMPRIGEYLDQVTKLILAFGLCFQLPVILTLMAMAGIVDAQKLSSFRRYAIVAIFVVAAVVTPADPISQLSLALPLALLYEVSVLAVRMIDISRRKRDIAEGRDITV